MANIAKIRLGTWIAALLAFWPVLAWSQADPISEDLSALSIEDLMNIEVDIASKRDSKLAETPAAVFVITQEDLRRSGATSIAQALRLVPGFNVSQLDSRNWGISARGFNGIFASRLLVLIDGRSVYSPLFGGVYWDTQDVVLEDVERIEVIRGPGGAIWGSNAVNGVVNVITKSAKDTQGWLLSGGGGNEERAFGTARYGAKLSDTEHLRLYTKYNDRDDSKLTSGGSAHDAWNKVQAGARYDAKGQSGETLTLQGDWYTTDSDFDITLFGGVPPYATNKEGDSFADGQNLLARWTRTADDQSVFTLQAYYDRVRRGGDVLDEELQTADIELTYATMLGSAHQLVAGAGWRTIWDDITPLTESLTFNTTTETLSLQTLFVQDEIALSDKLRLTLGSKFQHHYFSGTEVEPTVRMAYMPDANNAWWLAGSRAVRTATRVDDDVNLSLNTTVLPDGTPLVLQIRGDSVADEEELYAAEAGYRYHPSPSFFIDIAAFANFYETLFSLNPGEPEPVFSPNFYLQNPVYFSDDSSGFSHGVEITADWRASDWLTLKAGYTFVDVDIDLDDDAVGALPYQDEGTEPSNQFYIRSLVNLSSTVELDAWLRYTDSVRMYSVDPFFDLDLRVAWHVRPDLELAVVGQNLLHGSRQQYGTTFLYLNQTEIERAVYGKLTWKF